MKWKVITAKKRNEEEAPKPAEKGKSLSKHSQQLEIS